VPAPRSPGRSGSFHLPASRAACTIKGEPPPLDDLLETMTKRAKGLKLEGIRAEDLARSGGPSDEGGEST
jgi:hypothetical protein